MSLTAVSAAGLLAVAGQAVAVDPPVISVADVVSDPTVTITGESPGSLIEWQLRGPRGERDEDDEEARLSPVVIRFPDMPDGEYTVSARQSVVRQSGGSGGQGLGFGRGPFVERSGWSEREFTLDRLPPSAPQPLTPAPSGRTGPAPVLEWAPSRDTGSGVSGYRVEVGGAEIPVPTSQTSVQVPAPLPAGRHAWRVRALDGAGNLGEWSALAAFVVSVTPSSDPAPAPSAAPGPAAAAPAVARPSVRVSLSAITVSPLRLRPKPGARAGGLRPVLRWRKIRGAQFYNVQIFRLRGQRLIKITSVFPRRNALRVPRGRLRWGTRYVWRVWPSRAGRFTARPLGVSHFQTISRKTAISRAKARARARARARERARAG